MAFIIKVFTLPVEHGFVNGYTEWAKPSEQNRFGVTREPANATRYAKREAANLIRARYAAEFGHRVHVTVHPWEA